MNISYNDQWFGRGNTDGSGRNGINGEEPSEYELTAMCITYYIDIIASFINYKSSANSLIQSTCRCERSRVCD